MKKAVIYARYSCEKQTEQSIEGQLRVCNEFAERNGYTVIHNYIDRAVSGKTDKREQFQQMLKDSADKSFEFVIVYKLDRFARNRYDSAMNKATLKKNGVKVLSACEQITDTPEGIILESMIEGMAEYYSVECFYGHYLYDAPIYRLSSSRCSTVKIASQRQKFVTENI